MAEQDILQHLVGLPGQSQADRHDPALAEHFVDIDERQAKDLLLFSKKLSKYIQYYNKSNAVDGNWEKFFSYNDKQLTAWLNETAGKVPPHLSLLITFIHLYRTPQELINRITGRHLEFFYRDVLKFARKPAVPDKAHVLLELKKHAPATAINTTHIFSAGKDPSGVERLYLPTGETVINAAKVESLQSIYVDNSGHGSVRVAPIANSSDGIGGELSEDDPKWYGFGHPGLNPIELGFALAAPVLRMQEGSRKVIIELKLGNVNSTLLNTTTLNQAFEIFLTGTKSWIGPKVISPSLTGDQLRFELTVGSSEEAVVDYLPEVHGYRYQVQAPLLQVRLRPGLSKLGYNSFRNVVLKKALIKVEVSEVTTLKLENDAGALDAKKAFMPFGPQPTVGSRFLIGCEEALSKKLSELKITLQWKDTPTSGFSEHYKNYSVNGVNNSYFTATVSFNDGGTWNNPGKSMALFNSSNPASERTLTFSPNSTSVSSSPPAGMQYYALSTAGSHWAVSMVNAFILWNPVYSSFLTTPVTPRVGYITVSLNKDFLHSNYRTEYVKNVVTFSRNGGTLVVLNEPYVPTVQAISLGYKAHSDEVKIHSNLQSDFVNTDVMFFHMAYFGHQREHAYQRAQFDYLVDKEVSLLPQYNAAGELLIGVAALQAGDSLSLLFQVAEGSADAELSRETINWSVLCDNYWRPLGRDELIADTTNQLLTSGIVKFVIPKQATTTNTVMPAGKIWLKASIANNVNAVCQLLQVAANAVELQFSDQGNDPGHLNAALQQGQIAKLKTPVTAIKSLKQPYASFGGRPAELTPAFNTRVAERLRHKNRCITGWDYERLILEAFPRIHKVKCIPHAKPGSWLAPGNVLLVVVPDLRNTNSRDPLQPKVDADTLSRITEYVQARVGMQVSVQVKNPLYQKLKLDFQVKFKTGYEFNYYSHRLNQALIEFLSPWAYDATRPISFGGTVYKSVILDFVEELDMVDYVKTFKLYSYSTSTNMIDKNQVVVESPDAILVSEGSHRIEPAG